MTAMTFRPIDPDADRDVVLAFGRDLFAASFGQDRRATRDFEDGGTRYMAWIRKRIAEDPMSAVLVCDLLKPVGMIVIGRYKLDPCVGYVNHYYLAPEARGRGLGAQLDDYASKFLKSREHDRAILNVAMTNSQALHFYQKHGWVDVGPHPDQPDVHYFEKHLG